MVSIIPKENGKMFKYISLYLVSIHLLILTNVMRTGSQISTVVIDVIAVYSLLVAISIVSKKLCTADIKFSWLDIAVIVYLTYSTASIVLYFIPSNPASVKGFLYGVHLLILPSFIFFTVRNFDDVNQEKLLRLIIYLHLFMAVTGLVLFVWRPEFYTNNLRTQYSQQGYDDLWQLYSRLNSYMGSTATGILSAITIALLPMVKVRQLLKYVFVMVLMVTVLLTQQRGAYITMAISLLVFVSHSKRYMLRSFLVLAAIFIVAIMYLNTTSNTAVSSVYSIVVNRITLDILHGDYASERGHSFQKGLDISAQFPFGMGAGATTSAADDAGANPLGQVVDSNYMRIACDLGYFGLYLFIALILTAIFTIFRNNKNKHYLLILFIYLFQANFTNVFDVYYVNHLFWLFLGLINAKPLCRS